MRLFVAVDLPENVKLILDAARAPLRTALPWARWVGKPAFHVTLAFLGEVEANLLPTLGIALRKGLEQEGGFRARFAGIGTFPPAGRVRTVWVGLEPAARFARLAERVQDALATIGIAFDDKPFRSHVTLARCDPPWPAKSRAELAALAAACDEPLSAASLVCDRVTLFSSVLERAGPTYRAEVEIALSS